MNYTNREKEEMMQEIISICEEYTNQRWHSDGAYAVDEDCIGVINVYDYMDDYTGKKEDGELEEFVRKVVDESYG